MIDVANGEVLMDKTPEATRNLVVNMVANSQQFSTKLEHALKRVNKVYIFVVTTTYT